MRIKFYYILFLCFFIFQSHAYAQDYGLSFLGQEVVQEERTGLDLTPNTALSFENDFQLSFDISFIAGQKVYFGYIFRLIDDAGQNIDLIYDERFEENKHFKLIIGEEVSDIVFDIPLQELFVKWHTLTFMFNKSENRVTLLVGEDRYEHQFLFQKNNRLKVLFGANDYLEYKVTDVPTMKVKQISIHENQLLKYNWPLDDIEGSTVKETVKGAVAFAKNPVWIKKLHYEWQFLNTFTLTGPASIAFDASREELHVIGEDALATFSIPYFSLSYFPYRSGTQHLLGGNQSLYDTIENKLYNFYIDQKLVTTFNWEKGAWDEPYLHPDVVTNYWHPNKFYNHSDSTLYMLGGYGQYTYHKQVFRYTEKGDVWEEVSTTGAFTPRYLAALGKTVSGAYILGGYGSSTGQQFVNPRNLYDLVYFDVKEKSFTKVYEIQRKETEFAFANSMIIDEKQRQYYALQFSNHQYNTSLQLIKGSLDTPENYEVGNSIPYKFHDIHSFADLFYAPISKRFIAVTSLYDTARNETAVHVYSLLGPPLATIDEAQSTKSLLPTLPRVIFIVFLLLCFLGGAAYFWKKKGRIKAPSPVNGASSVVTVTDGGQAEPIAAERNAERVLKNAIYLFGFMQLYDAKGNDITKLFSPLIKELFLLIFLASQKSGVGISSEKLTEHLWFDKTAESARNNRSVNIAKLKAILEHIEGCVLTKETGYWKINLNDDGVYVDYCEYLKRVNAKQQLSKEEIYDLAKITQRGAFLANSEHDWLDTYKSEISHTIVDAYLHIASSTELREDPEFIVELTNYIFHFDFVNEEAMILKCKALEYLGKHSHVKTTFESFIKEYKAIYGEEFDQTLTEILD